MDDQSHIFQLLFQEQIDEYKQSLSSIDDLFEQKEQQQQKEHPITITVIKFCFIQPMIEMILGVYRLFVRKRRFLGYKSFHRK